MLKSVYPLNHKIGTAILLAGLLGSCASPSERSIQRNHAFVSYFGAVKSDGRLRLAVKDLIDMKGLVTTAGSEYLAKNGLPAERDADCPAIDKAIDDPLVAKGFKVVKLDTSIAKKWLQVEADGEVIATSDAWMNDKKYTNNLPIDSNTRAVLTKGALDNTTAFNAALKRKTARKRDLARVFRKVDFITTPTLMILPLRKPFWRSTAIYELFVLSAQTTSAVNFAENLALAMPAEMSGSDITTNLQLIGPPLSEAKLLNVSRLHQNNKQPTRPSE